MSNINCGIGVLHVKRQILTYFFVTSFLCSLQFLLFYRIEYPKRCIWKKKKCFYGSVFVIWLYLQKAMYRPCDLDHWPMKVNCFQWIEYNPIIGILYIFQIDISSNSWEIKYQSIGRTHRHTQTHRQTDRVKTIPRNPLRGRGNNCWSFSSTCYILLIHHVGHLLLYIYIYIFISYSKYI